MANLSNGQVQGPIATERHFSPATIAALWNLSPSKVRRMFADEPGVIKIGEPSRRVGRKLKRSYHALKIPQTVVERVHAWLRNR